MLLTHFRVISIYMNTITNNIKTTLGFSIHFGMLQIQITSVVPKFTIGFSILSFGIIIPILVSVKRTDVTYSFQSN